MKINFKTPFNHEMTKQMYKEVSSITVKRIIDNPNRKFVAVQTNEIGRVVLWENQEYDSIGQWTDSDVVARLHEIYGQ